jgi:hypothetical protein
LITDTFSLSEKELQWSQRRRAFPTQRSSQHRHDKKTSEKGREDSVAEAGLARGERLSYYERIAAARTVLAS